ncbi:RluA family pseudouridine synthase [Pseudochryseolinea flava]|uniref:RluA family pseudouridine synthase n=1 Tax=Pseudochryseolinea flava TaxID=2059302 RepID=A0A364Y482_9BACT|nr:RNA pseudouridine synthase [Pseudochryseolinea flava]RAW00851.1 RluA family pseudouridine synthase [Pseudochryseolinea flava]
MLINVSNHILFEDEYVLVINKPHGLMVEPDRNGHHNLLHQVQGYIRNNVAKGNEVYAQHIHRLDRPVSGIVLFAKQRSVLKNLSEQFAERRVKKFYQALTSNTPAQAQGTLDHWHRKEKKKAAIYEEAIPYTEQANLAYKVTALEENRFLWDIALHTGKFHQIRAQLAHVHCPVIGDELYGSSIAYQPNAIALTASKLVFFHPVQHHEIVIEVKGFSKI